MQKRACIALVFCTLLFPGPFLVVNARAGWQDDVGFTALSAELAQQLPTGDEITVCQVEAPTVSDGVATWMPDPDDAAFVGKSIFDESRAPDGVYSSHATSVGRLLYGLSTSMAPGIATVHSYSVSHWAQSGGLRFGYSLQPGACECQLANHSWVSSALSTSDRTSELLRRLDWQITRDGQLHVVGLTNTATTTKPLLGSAFNVITVGKTDGEHSPTTVEVDDVYSGGRIRPHLVAPASCSSASVPIVGGGAALLMQTMRDHPDLATDPLATTLTSRSGDIRYNGELPVVLRAILMAGADRFTQNSTDADILDYRLEADTRTDNGLDSRYGAGQLNIQRSYHILMAGEQNSEEDGGAEVKSDRGFDYDPAFGGLNDSNSEATYAMNVSNGGELLTASLTWDIAIDSGELLSFSGTAAFYDLNLELNDLTSGEVVCRSAGTGDNSEHLFYSLSPGHTYVLRVVPADGSDLFLHSYALAWDLQADADNDHIPDSIDNCPHSANRKQRNSDGDAYGDRCDCDLNNDDRVDAADYWRWRLWGTIAPSAEAWKPEIDFNGNGKADAEDLSILQERLGQSTPYY